MCNPNSVQTIEKAMDSLLALQDRVWKYFELVTIIDHINECSLNERVSNSSLMQTNGQIADVYEVPRNRICNYAALVTVSDHLNKSSSELCCVLQAWYNRDTIYLFRNTIY